MSRAKGLEAPSWVAGFLRAWFPSAVKTPNSRKGRDIENTPGIAFEVKTSPHWRHKSIAQAAGYADGRGELALVVYLPPGLGEAQVANALVVLPLWAVMPLAVAAGYAPEPRPRPVGDRPGLEELCRTATRRFTRWRWAGPMTPRWWP